MPGSISCRDGVYVPTGRRRYRVTWRGKLVLQVEVAERVGHTEGPEFVWTGHSVTWRDATVFDLVRTRGEVK